MTSLTLFFVIPAGLFVAIAILYYVRGSLPRGMMLLPILACYVCAAVILVLGGCHNVAHVALEGLEVDLVNDDGTPRDIVIGGEAGKDQPSGIEIPGYPVDALRLRLEPAGLTLHPGPGYQRGLLVRSGGRLVPLEPSGLPRMIPLVSGDRLRVADDEGGAVLAQWKLGTGRYDLNLKAGAWRWIGGDTEKDIARVEGLPPQVLALRAEGSALIIKRGPGFNPKWGVLLNGRRLSITDNDEYRTVYQPDVTMLAIVAPDPAVGVMELKESGLLRSSAVLDWESPQHDKPAAYPFEMEPAHVYRVGGALEDDLVVKGLPPGALQLVISPRGELSLTLTDSGRKAAADHRLCGSYPQTISTLNQGVRLGPDADPAGGVFVLLGMSGAESSPAPAQSAATLSSISDESESIDAEPVVDAPVATAATASSPPSKWRCAWLPNAATHWELPNREITLPLMNLNQSLWSRRPWTQQVFPLGGVTPCESSLRSMLVYGQPHESFWFNGVNLLQFERGIRIERNGSVLQPKTVVSGLLDKAAPLEFLQIMADEQGETHGVSFGSPTHPAHVWGARRVSLRKRLPVFTVIARTESVGRHERKIPVLHVSFEKPVVRSIPLGEVKADLKARTDAPSDIKVAVNDRTGFSTLQHQVLFPGLSRWFDSANGDIQLNWSSLEAQDDWRLQPAVNYGEPFKIGGDRRLSLRVTKHSIPWQETALVVGMGIVACGLCLWQGAGFSWAALYFGAASLTCSRVLFGQASLVNPPFNGEILSHARVALVAAPLLLGVGGRFIGTLLPGRIERRLRQLESWISYGWLAVIAVAGLLIRVGLLGLGFKEAFGYGSTRIALSIAFVPFYLLLFALCFFVLWREKQAHRTLRWAQIWPFIRCALVLSVCQTVTALLVSDLGMMLYFIPQALVMAVIGLVAGTESVLQWLREDQPDSRQRRQSFAFAVLSGLLPILPLLAMTLLFVKPLWMLGMVPGLSSKIMTEEQVMSDDASLITDSTLLRVLQFTHRDYLINLGTDSAERIAQDHAIMENYARRGLLGEGYLNVDILPAKFVTAMNDNVSAIFVFAQFGVFGALAVLVAYVAISLATRAAQGRAHSFTSWLALIAGLSFSFVSLYMMAANYGLLPFTGRNMYLLGLNSQSDIVESLLLLLCIVLGIARAEFHERAESVQNATSIGLGEIIGKSH